MTKHLFEEEQQLVRALSEEWTQEVQVVLDEMAKTFSQKAGNRDGCDVVWRRLPFPDGFLTIIDQKRERLEPLMDPWDPHAPGWVVWPKVVEECEDVASYWIFMAAIARMFDKRDKTEVRTPPVERRRQRTRVEDCS